MTQQQDVDIRSVHDGRANAVPVIFDSEGSRLSGDLYVPPDYTSGTRAPGIVVAESWTTVKEQMAGLYAQRRAQRGFVTLAFDFRSDDGYIATS